MKRKLRKVLIVLLVVVGVVFPLSNIISLSNKTSRVSQNVSYAGNNKKIVSLYCWEMENFNLSKLKEEVEYLGVNTLYIQSYIDPTQVDRFRQIMEFAKRYNIDVFLLDGYYDWLTTGDMGEVTNLIDYAAKLNETLDYKIKGVSLDVEFYSGDEYQSASQEGKIEMFKTFTAKTHQCADYAKSKGLRYSMALPVWFDKLDASTLEDLMNYDYDHIAFMNYARSGIMNNLDKEVEIAKKYDINIVTIAELQSTDYVPKDDTFDVEGLGVEKCIEALKNQQKKYAQDPYNYEKLGISYHYYTPLVSLLERDTDSVIGNKYELEVHPYKNDESIKVDEAFVSADGVNFEPIYGYYTKEGEYVINFYDLEYGKEYTITVKSGTSTITKTFVYQKGDKDLNKIEIARMNIEFTSQTNSDEEQKPNEPSTPDEPNTDEEQKPDDPSTADEPNTDEEQKPDKPSDDEKNPSIPEQPDQSDDNKDNGEDVVVPPVVDGDDGNSSNDNEQNNSDNQNSNVDKEQQEDKSGNMSSMKVSVPNTGTNSSLYMFINGIVLLISAGILIKTGLKTEESK